MTEMSDVHYKLKARRADGSEVAAADSWVEEGFKFRIAGVRVNIARLPDELEDEFTEPTWGSEDLEHGSEVVLRGKAKGKDRQVRFVVEYKNGEGWSHYATVPGEVKSGEATAKLRVHHPSLPPVGNVPDDAGAQRPGQLRFFIEDGPAQPQPHAGK